ncbi:MAG: dockerin type I domain-containing protein [Armatimonadota bacterium]
MRRWLGTGSLVTAVWLVFAFCTAAVGQEISVLNVSALPAERANVNVVLDANVRGVTSAQFVLDFSRASSESPPTLYPPKDMTGMAEVRVTLGPIVPAETLVSASARVRGQVSVGLVGVSPFSGPGVMVTIPLQVSWKASPGVAYELLLRDVLLYAEDGSSVPVQVRNGALTVAALLAGDASGDGIVDVRDVMDVLHIAVGLVDATPAQLMAADVTKDGRVTVLDAQYILRMARGLVPISPEAGRNAIVGRYLRLANAIEAEDIDTLMSFVSRDYLHDGVNYDGFRTAFAQYFADHQSVRATFGVKSVEIEVVDSTYVAYVTFDEVISGRRISDLGLEEERYQDAYMVWILEGGVWRMVGNQESAKTMSAVWPGLGVLLGGAGEAFRPESERSL